MKRIAEVLFILGFVLGYCAKFVNPRHLWIAQPLALVLPFISCGIVLGTLSQIYQRKWTKAGIYVVLCVLIMIRFSTNRLPSKHDGELSSGSFSLFSLNVGKMAQDRSSLDRFIKIIDTIQPDIISLQEAHFRVDSIRGILLHREPIGRLLSKGYFLASPNSTTASALLVTNPTLTRVRPLETRLLRVDDTDSDTLKSFITRTVVKIEEQSLAVYNLQFRSFNSGPEAIGGHVLNPRYWIRRIRSYKKDFIVRARQAERVVHILRSETLPYIVTGDFNSTRHNWVYQHLTEVARDAFRVSGSGFGATFPAYLPLIRIDHIFVSPEIFVHESSVENTIFSDHLLNKGTFSIRHKERR